MTSSSKHLKPGEPRWNYNVQRYKSLQDVFCEPNLYSILFLACGRPEITKKCLLSTIEALNNCPLELEWILMENGKCEENYQLFNELDLNRKVIIRQENFGINEAINQMYALSRGEYICLLENDWECRQKMDFIAAAHAIFQDRNDIGIVQLRAITDNAEQWGRGKAEYWPWDCNEIKLNKKSVTVWDEQTTTGYEYKSANHVFSWNNNPHVVRKAIYRLCGPLEEAEMSCDPRHGETLMQLRVAELGLNTAHIGKELYYHVGQQPTRSI